MTPASTFTTDRCKVDGCAGTATIRSDGRGGLVEHCVFCERRRAWEVTALAKGIPRPKCFICGAELPVQKIGRQPIQCTACTRVVARVRKRQPRFAA